MKPYSLHLIVSTLTLALISSCSDSSYKEQDLTGTWVKDKLVNYNGGKQSIVTPQSGSENSFVGSLENPRTITFTKYSEIVFSGLRGNPDRVYGYSVNGDSIAINNEDFVPQSMSIDKLTSDSLYLSFEMKLPYLDKSAPYGKWIMKEYYHKAN
ncbi:hypothetical protein [uncultured Hymenobacter sp.]|uniref:hypothetical protein n=1 Tax=uncultured Hymenobacter sp. TaxID=170016 RepID=UPI0035C9C791